LGNVLADENISGWPYISPLIAAALLSQHSITVNREHIRTLLDAPKKNSGRNSLSRAFSRVYVGFENHGWIKRGETTVTIVDRPALLAFIKSRSPNSQLAQRLAETIVMARTLSSAFQHDAPPPKHSHKASYEIFLALYTMIEDHSSACRHILKARRPKS
jgi:hypothetical protein